MTSDPMTFPLEAINMITAIKGAATRPLRIAAQKSALTGAMCIKFSERPIRVATVMAA